MKPLLDDAEYQEIYQTLASTERGQAFLNTFAEKHNSLETKKLQTSCNTLSDFAYSVAQDFSSADEADTVENLDDFEQPADLSALTPEPDENNLPDIGELSASEDDTAIADLMVDTDDIEVDFAPEAETEVPEAEDDPSATSDEAAMNNDLAQELSELKARMVDLEVKISAL